MDKDAMDLYGFLKMVLNTEPALGLKQGKKQSPCV
jgi:hypothetical protein